ncbi:MAG: hypothetical protein JXA03_08890, partial [Bacteroidales bacterium]|nr:hypothetical protein [Bacteroidales bacterium]
MKIKILFLLLIIVSLACQSNKKGTQEKTGQEEFPSEMVSFQAFENNPIFSGTNQNTWDAFIRERGFILIEDGIYKMWYTGYGGMKLICHASDPKYEDTFLLGPDLIAQLKLKRKIMLKHWTD